MPEDTPPYFTCIVENELTAVDLTTGVRFNMGQGTAPCPKDDRGGNVVCPFSFYLQFQTVPVPLMFPGCVLSFKPL